MWNIFLCELRPLAPNIPERSNPPPNALALGFWNHRPFARPVRPTPFPPVSARVRPGGRAERVSDTRQVYHPDVPDTGDIGKFQARGSADGGGTAPLRGPARAPRGAGGEMTVDGRS